MTVTTPNVPGVRPGLLPKCAEQQDQAVSISLQSLTEIFGVVANNVGKLVGPIRSIVLTMWHFAGDPAKLESGLKDARTTTYVH